jgi:CDP-diacylglycerol--serine O-phosphatidyltransferase
MILLFSWLMIAEIPMFSLKFKNLSWKDNKISFIFLIIAALLLVFWESVVSLPLLPGTFYCLY